MLGYSKKDIFDMQDALEHGINYANDVKDMQVAEGLISTLDLLNGLIAEGRI
jgi:cell fate (sporulation/competence/biofilm development) regulator YmcA (YheA/YmcA/DUF963 family)